jgi:RNA polymerase sigma-70 factor (ECF subfamily)
VSQRPAQQLPNISDPEVFSQFYRTHLPTVYGYVLRLCGGDRTRAEDLTQDVWMALTDELRQGRTERADIRWLLTVARSRFIDQTRRQLRAIRTLTLVATSEEHLDPPTRDQVLDGLQSLEPMHRIVLMLHYVDDLPVTQVATAIDRSVAATTSLLARARVALREHHRSNSND